MQKGAHSRTAEVTAAIRAGHLLYDHPLVFEDPYAIALTSPLWRTICASPILHRLVIRGLFKSLRPVHGWILSRDSLTERTLQEAVADGCPQFVLLGAGFDSIALRNPSWLGETRIFEVDFPATQSKKRERLAALVPPVEQPEVRWISLDLEVESLAGAMRDGAYDSSARALFSWQGVIYYLTQSAIDDTLDSIAALTSSGSELLFDFLLPENMMSGKERRVLSFADSFTRRLGERYISFHSVDDIARLLERHGFDVKRIWLDQEIAQEIVGQRDDGLSVMRGFGIAHAIRR